MRGTKPGSSTRFDRHGKFHRGLGHFNRRFRTVVQRTVNDVGPRWTSSATGSGVESEAG